MSIIDQLLGSNGSQESGSINESDSSSSFGASPVVGLQTGELLGLSSENHSSDGDNGDFNANSNDLSVVDGLGIGFAAPIHADFENSSSSTEVSDTQSDGGGLLGGLL